MKNGVYAATAGMMTTAEKLNILSNNIANSDTNGFKEDMSFEQTIRFLAEGPAPGKDQPIIGGTLLNLQNGVIKHTERKLDMAFEGPGFFAVQGPGNQEIYTRNGAFNLNSKRELVTSEGYSILDKFNNKITIFGEKFSFTPKGDIFVDDTYYTTLKVVNLTDPLQLEKVGDNFIKMKDANQQPQLLENPRMLNGAVEKSNVNIMKGIAEMIQIERSFELQKNAGDLMLKSIRKVITDVPKPV